MVLVDTVVRVLPDLPPATAVFTVLPLPHTHCVIQSTGHQVLGLSA